MSRGIPYIAFLFLLMVGCKDKQLEPVGDLTDIPYNPVLFVPQVPEGFPVLEVPEDNPGTVDGVMLGRKLFFDPVLSRDSTMSCSSCHLQSGSFTDNLPVSPGVDGINGRRSAMSLLDIGFNQRGLFWDGRVQSLEEQALLPVEDPIEMHAMWPEVIEKLRNHPHYPADFRKAFGIEDRSEIDRRLAAKAIAQYERAIVSSGESRFDKFMRGEIFLTDSEYNGFDMFFDVSPDLPDAECAHCHAAPLFTNNDYRNNGLDDPGSLDDFIDKGRGEVTGDRFDNGKFRIPTLRNAVFSAPYMHDGRFNTLEEVIDHYNSGGSRIDNTDPLIRPLGLTPSEKQDLLNFLHTLTDTVVLNDPMLANPF